MINALGTPVAGREEACPKCQNTGWCHANKACVLSGYSLSPQEPVASADIEARIGVLSDAHKSISKNTCCDNCREAANVARSALASYVGLARTPPAPGADRAVCCPSCHRTDEAYHLSPPCTDPWHGDDHLRAKAVSGNERGGK